MSSKFLLMSLALISLQLLLEVKSEECEMVTEQEAYTYKSKSVMRLEKNYIRWVIYNNDIVLIYDYNKEDSTEGRCEIIKVNPASSAVRNAIIKSTGQEGQFVTFKTMKEWISQCTFAADGIPAGISFKNGMESEKKIVFSVMYPATKWCGNDTFASNYFDLGVDEALDRCCRAFQMCPVSIPAKATKYGIENAESYPQFHCDCKKTFDECLVKIGGRPNFAKLKKEILFPTECVKPEKCVEIDGLIIKKKEEKNGFNIFA